MSAPSFLDRLRTMAESVPPGGSVTLPADWLREQIEAGAAAQPAEPAPTTAPATWRERLWTVPAETRFGVKEVAEALGRPTSFVYRHTSTKAAERYGYTLIPHRRLDGLVFLAGEVREWIERNEDVLVSSARFPKAS